MAKKKKKQSFDVRLPIAGYAIVTVEATDAEDALEKAMAAVTIQEIEEWDAHRTICEGNLFHGNCNEASVFDADGDECEVKLRTSW